MRGSAEKDALIRRLESEKAQLEAERTQLQNEKSELAGKLSASESALSQKAAYAGKLEEDLNQAVSMLEMALEQVGVPVHPNPLTSVRLAELLASVTQLKSVVTKLVNDQLQQGVRDALAVALALLKLRHPDLSLEALRGDLPKEDEEELLAAMQDAADDFAERIEAPPPA